MSPMRSLRPVALALVASAAVLAALVNLAGARVAPIAVGGASHADEASEGRQLFAVACSSCHGPAGAGTENGVSLIGVGAASADFQLTTGRMPFAGAPGSQAKRKPPAFEGAQIDQLVAFVASLGAGPAIPSVRIDEGLLSRGQKVFIDNCAPCHGSTANGGAVGRGSLAPPLDRATSTQVGEALLIGPGQMPAFPFSAEDVNAVATYVDYLQRAPNPGGFSIGGIGPVPEGFVAWVLGMGLLLVLAYLIGREWDRSEGGRPGAG
jgi:quinol---cytochrome-c reductase cytochrome c subunit